MARVAIKQLGLSKNWLINGNFDFWQRTSGQTLVTTTRAYGADRWMVFPSTTSVNAAQMIRAVSTNIGSIYDMNFGPWSFNQKCSAAQIVEEKNTVLLRGKDVTFSFKAKSGGTNPIRFQILGWTGTADSVTTFTNAVPYTNWTTYSLAANFVSIAVGTGTNVSTGYTQFSCSGSVPTNVNNIICIITYAEDGGQQQYISQTMLNEGLGSQNFSLFTSNIGTELAACQRYFCKSMPQATPAANNTGIENGAVIHLATITGPITFQFTIPFPVTMRTSATVTFYGIHQNNSNFSNIDANNDGGTGASFNGTPGGDASFAFGNSGSFNATGLMGIHWSAQAEL